MKPKIHQEKRAYKAWKVLANSAQKCKYITYKDLAKDLGIHHRAIRYVLRLIQDFCIDNEYPPLTILVVNKKTGKPGDGFIAWDIENSEDGVKKVFNFDWKSIRNPYKYAQNGDTIEDLISDLIEKPSSSADIYAKIQTRGMAQRLFRSALLRVYDYSCCICGLSFENVLEACHIIPYSKSDKSQRLEISNGLLLCANHHKMFDCGLITINQNYLINFYDIKEEDGEYSNYDKLMTINLHKKKITLPKTKKHRPRLNYLFKHQHASNE